MGLMVDTNVFIRFEKSGWPVLPDCMRVTMARMIIRLANPKQSWPDQGNGPHRICAPVPLSIWTGRPSPNTSSSQARGTFGRGCDGAESLKRRWSRRPRSHRHCCDKAQLLLRRSAGRLNRQATEDRRDISPSVAQSVPFGRSPFSMALSNRFRNTATIDCLNRASSWRTVSASSRTPAPLRQ